MNNHPRYNRQVALPEIGAQGQEKISAASVLCVGAGGLGCPALLYLAAAGVGKIGIVDFDVVDETNLQRQVLFTVDQIGQKKAQAAKLRLNALNPDIEIISHPIELTDKNAEEIFRNYDLILDGTDNFATKFLINDAAIKTGKPFVYGSILGFDGQISIFNYDDGPCYRCLFPAPPKSYIPNCAEAGVIGAVAGIIGAAQAMEALKIIIQHKSFAPLSGRLWNLDLRTMENHLLSLPKNSNCPSCSRTQERVTLQYASPLCNFIPELTAEQARNKKTALFIDVREEDEWNAGHIKEAQHIALSTLTQGFTPDLPTACDIILYCKKGMRGQQAAQILKNQGCQNIYNMAGGFDAWVALPD